uniref:Uncharacterized protein n=1 Tax=Corethron hystrix TaxID=216773 RepID=A0A6U5EFV8_9STRA|mmetsp:Transcript_17355/g.39176  ORF Transcript_17355/g.39176 Transcript_17355/m.39176 type:complete len:193 (+) Transcript_17355:771-1349(+)
MFTRHSEAKRPEPLTSEAEAASPPAEGNPTFFRPVPPFQWHKKWSGTSWTWGPTSGDRGWSVEEMEEADAWHGRARGDIEGIWSMRLGGGVLVQVPKVIVGGQPELFRLAWLPEEGRLSRIEAGVTALGEVDDVEDDGAVRFAPPQLTSLRTDVFKMAGELEGVSKMEFLRNLGAEKDELGPDLTEEDTAFA